MRRREFLLLLGAASAAWPAAGLAQPSGRTFRIGVFSGASDSPIIAPAYRAFVAELARLGFREGDNLNILFQSTRDSPDVIAARAKDLAASNVDALVSLGTEAPLQGAVAASKTIPIVFVANNFDPIARGYVTSLANPGGNVTGIFLRQLELAEKQVELLVEAFPDRRQLAVLWDSLSADQFKSAEARARHLGLQLLSLRMENPPYDLDAAFRRATETGAQMLLALTTPYFGAQSGPLVELTVRYRLPSMFIFKPYTVAGGLMSYGADTVAMYTQGAALVAKVLRGAKPSTLPVELPIKFELAVNLKTAKAIGVELPTSILLRANEVIE
jgi:putative tryptophan/tyrosine transport system substrate-binding protein